MTCDERCDNLIPLYAAGALDPAERDDVRAHLAAGCPRCAGALAELESALAHLPLALDPVRPSAAAKARLMQRIREAKPRPGVAGTIRPAPSPVRRVAIAALIALALGAAITWAAMSARQRSLQAVVNDKSQMIAQLTGDLRQAKDLMRFMGARDLRVAELTGTDAQPTAGLRVFWDRDAGTWTVAARGLKQPAAGNGYELWYVTTDERKLPAAMFMPDPDGTALVRLTLPPNLGPVALAAITEEKSGQIPTEPHGAIQAAGKINQ